MPRQELLAISSGIDIRRSIVTLHVLLTYDRQELPFRKHRRPLHIPSLYPLIEKHLSICSFPLGIIARRRRTNTMRILPASRDSDDGRE